MPKLLLRSGRSPDHAGGAYSAPPGSLAGLRGPTSTGKGKGGKGKGREGERDLEVAPPSKLSGSAYEGSGGEGEEGREGRVCLVLKSPLATPLMAT